MAKYQFMIRITFRNGKILTRYTNQLSIQTDPGYNKFRLWFDGKPQLKILKGQPNIWESGEYTLHHCTPVKENLFDYFPDDWDKDDERFNVVDEVYVSSRGITTDD